MPVPALVGYGIVAMAAPGYDGPSLIWQYSSGTEIV